MVLFVVLTSARSVYPIAYVPFVIARVIVARLVHLRGERLVEESRRHELEESARGITTSTAAIPTGSVAHTSQHQVRCCVFNSHAKRACYNSRLRHGVGVVQLNFHLKIVNPIFAAVVEVLPAFQIGMAQALHNTENWKRMAQGEEPVTAPLIQVASGGAATLVAAASTAQ
eukprot:COSAG02_NODE_2684_length_8241_cov_14.362442_3_plen_171_part_00